MNLMDDEANKFNTKQTDKSKKSLRIILVLMILLIIGIITIIAIMPLFKQTTLSVQIDGKENAKLKSILNIQENGQIYVPIKDVAQYLGYESFNGNYINKSENTNECYVEDNNEVANFKVESNRIEKINKSTSKQSYLIADEPVLLQDGKLYTTMDGIKKAFNVVFNYNIDNKKISIYTMDYLVKQYTNNAKKLGYEEVSTGFEDKKAILEGLLIAKDSKQKYGVMDVQNNENILEPKYDKISYNSIFEDFIIQSNDKYGIISKDGKEKIKIQYDSIQLISQDSKLYLVKSSNKYGIIDENEKVIIPINCDTLGISSKNFENNNIKNNIILLNKIIPIKINGLWALYDIEGNKLTDFSYNSFGCTSSKAQNASSIVVIPDYNVVIGNKNKKYVLINENGQELLNGMEFDEAYLIKNYDQTNYYVVKDKKTYDAAELLEELKNRNS
ncbi:MAG: WG repeat-containing protein [Clostridia bacterium]|nr:WG repeat-containing protein [Clostridia bacterium]